MLSESEASAFLTAYNKQILCLRLRMTLWHSLGAEEQRGRGKKQGIYHETHEGHEGFEYF